MLDNSYPGVDGSFEGGAHAHPANPAGDTRGETRGEARSAAAGGAFDAPPFGDWLANPALGARRLNVVANKVLYETHEAARNLYFVHRGQVRTYRVGEGEGRLLEILGPEGWCGEVALTHAGEGPWAYGELAVAVVPTVVSEVPADKLLALLAQHPRLAIEFMRQLAGKLSASREEAAGLVFQDCHTRLLRTLVRFSVSAAASPHPEGVVLRITHHQLAQAVGVARETVSLALTQLRQQNLLRTGRNQLMFNPDALRTFEVQYQRTRRNGSTAGATPGPAAERRGGKRQQEAGRDKTGAETGAEPADGPGGENGRGSDLRAIPA